jgi:DNA-binding MarR family transcriptional regulator
MAHAIRSALANSAVHLLHRAGQSADETFARIVGRELTPRQFAILAAVAEANGINQVGIVEATGIDRSSTAELVRKLQQRGFVQRRRDRRDTRSYIVTLTPKGRELVERLRPTVARVDETVLEGLARADRTRLLEALAQIALNAPRLGR